MSHIFYVLKIVQLNFMSITFGCLNNLLIVYYRTVLARLVAGKPTIKWVLNLWLDVALNETKPYLFIHVVCVVFKGKFTEYLNT